MKKILAGLAMSLPLVAGAVAPVTVDYDASVWVNASTGDLAPYMIGSWNYGRITGANGVWQTGLSLIHI